MLTVLRIELYKIFMRPRTYISFGAIAAIVMLIQLALYVDGDTYVSFMLQSIKNTFNVEGKVMNGYLICYIVLQTLLIHVPLLIAMVGGDMFAGEAAMGTLRLIATKPISRTSLLMGKYLATITYTIALLLWMAFLALLLSLVFFGKGDMLIFQSEQIVQIKSNDILWRYFLSFGFASLAMITVATISFFLSLFAENSLGPIATTMSVVIVATILSTMDIPLFNLMKPYLFTSQMLGWKGYFDNPIDYATIGYSAKVLVVYILVLLGASWWVFKKKDILS